MDDPQDLRSYGKIYNIGHAASAGVLDHTVVVQEKVDGSQFSFGVRNHKLLMRSKRRAIYSNDETIDSLFRDAALTVQTMAGLGVLHEGWTYRGEVLHRPKHNTLEYGRVPTGNVILFDIDAGEDAYLSYDDVAAEARRIGLEVVPLLFEGFVDQTRFDDLLDTVSVLGNTKVEGLVFKPVDPVFDKYGRTLMAKFVSPAFREMHEVTWPKQANRQFTAVAIIQQYGTEARWLKAVQHLRDAGVLIDGPRDIGAIVREVGRDVWDEEGDRIADMLVDSFRSPITKGLTRGLAEWYKDRLAAVAMIEEAH